MENPAQEIEGVVLALCTRPQAEQQAALHTYFTPDAAFVHPLCRVPAFDADAVRRCLPARVAAAATAAAGGRPLESRRLVAAVFRWYKILSPRIELGIESVAWDRASNTLFVALHQRFAVWFLPLYAVHVRLVTELRLVRGPVVAHGGDGAHGGTGSSSSYAAVAAAAAAADGDDPPPTRYYIARQEDHYQVNELVKFFSFNLGAWLWALVQLFATLVCVGGVLVVDTSLGLVRVAKSASRA